MIRPFMAAVERRDDAYEINYDFIYSVRNIMDYVARGYEWAMDDYYEALDIRNDDLRWVLSIGSALLEMAENYIANQGKKVVRIHLGGEGFEESKIFYPKHGYVEYRERYMMKNL